CRRDTRCRRGSPLCSCVIRFRDVQSASSVSPSSILISDHIWPDRYARFHCGNGCDRSRLPGSTLKHRSCNAELRGKECQIVNQFLTQFDVWAPVASRHIRSFAWQPHGPRIVNKRTCFYKLNKFSRLCFHMIEP